MTGRASGPNNGSELQAMQGWMHDSPSVSLALPPEGWHRTVAHEPHWTTVEAWEKTVLRIS